MRVFFKVSLHYSRLLLTTRLDFSKKLVITMVNVNVVAYDRYSIPPQTLLNINLVMLRKVKFV